ncbi:MAG TPA: DUF6133 family protein [Clostridia bacterium]|nr:DUF6133 family protein [Clostridia bacterium]
MKKLFKKVQNEMIKASIVGKDVLRSDSGEGFVDSAVFSVLRCYDRITTIRKRVNNKMNMVRFRVNELMNRSKVVLLDQRGEGAISQVVSILTAVVLGSLILMGMYKLIGEIVLPMLQERIIEMFNYTS